MLNSQVLLQHGPLYNIESIKATFMERGSRVELGKIKYYLKHENKSNKNNVF